MTAAEPGNSKSSEAGAALASLNGMAFIALIGCASAVLSAFIFMGSMTYTLAHYRSWDGMVAFVVSLIFAVLALLSAIPLLIAENNVTLALLPRVIMWGTAAVLTGLQLTAATLGDAHISLSAIIGVTTVLAVPCFGELAAHGIAES
ncbi:hypothetical protein [Streptomyces sp. NPDC037389]|uniref:hypothetical protein n=1 Tax=Streptomyces sp. NPDC037389 TaxID=3155369 RepID=UPI00340945D6